MKIPQNVIPGIILLTTGSYKTYTDYKNSPKEQKMRTLVRNVSTLGSATVAVFYTNKFLSKKLNSEIIQNFSNNITSKILNNKYISNLRNKIIPNIKLKPAKFEVLSDVVANFTKDIALSSVAAICGISIGLLVDKLLFIHQKQEQKNNNEDKTSNLKNINNATMPEAFRKFINNKVVTTVANERTKNIILNSTRVFATAGFISNPFDMPALVLNSVDYAKEHSFKKIFEQTSVGIVASALIPAFLMSLGHSLTKTRNACMKIVGVSSGFLLGNLLVKHTKHIHMREIKQEEKTEKITA